MASSKSKDFKKRSKRIKDALKTEAQVASDLGCEHRGGPSNPDMLCGGKKGEVKDRQTKVTKPELMRLAKKGNRTVYSTAGFTKPALTYKDRYRPSMTLCTPDGCDK